MHDIFLLIGAVMCFYTRFLNISSDCHCAICPSYRRERTSLINTHLHGESTVQICPADYECIPYSFYGLIGQKRRSRLKTISDGGSETRKRCGVALNVWQASHALLITSSSCRVASSIWFGRARLITSYNFPNVGCLKWRCSLIISDSVNKIDFEFHVR